MESGWTRHGYTPSFILPGHLSPAFVWMVSQSACILAESLASCTPLVLLPKLFSLESAPLLDFWPILDTEGSSGRDDKGLRQSPWGRLTSPFPRAHIQCRSAPLATGGARKRDSPSAGRGEGRGAAAPGPRESWGWALGGQLAAPPDLQRRPPGARGSGRRGCAVTWAAATGPHLSGQGTAPACSASSGSAPAGRPALCPPGALHHPRRAMRARAPPR